jgi:hypothetical protein
VALGRASGADAGVCCVATRARALMSGSQSCIGICREAALKLPGSCMEDVLQEWGLLVSCGGGRQCSARHGIRRPLATNHIFNLIIISSYHHLQHHHRHQLQLPCSYQERLKPNPAHGSSGAAACPCLCVRSDYSSGRRDRGRERERESAARAQTRPGHTQLCTWQGFHARVPNRHSALSRAVVGVAAITCSKL